MTEWGGGDGKPGKIPCPHCGKQLVGRAGVHAHIKSKHPKKPRKEFAPLPAADDDETFADRAVQAQIDRAAGIDNPDIDWLLP